MKKIKNAIGCIFAFGAILFPIVVSSVVVSSPGESRDIFGLLIPIPPVWTSFIPLGSVVGFIFELISLHGILIICTIIIFVNIALVLLRDDKK